MNNQPDAVRVDWDGYGYSYLDSGSGSDFATRRPDSQPLFVTPPVFSDPKWKIGDRVGKVRGSAWVGKVVGYYSTSLTPRGYAVESEIHSGSVQIYPEAALEGLP